MVRFYQNQSSSYFNNMNEYEKSCFYKIQRLELLHEFHKLVNVLKTNKNLFLFIFNKINRTMRDQFNPYLRDSGNVRERHFWKKNQELLSWFWWHTVYDIGNILGPSPSFTKINQSCPSIHGQLWNPFESRALMV